MLYEVDGGIIRKLLAEYQLDDSRDDMAVRAVAFATLAEQGGIADAEEISEDVRWFVQHEISTNAKDPSAPLPVGKCSDAELRAIVASRGDGMEHAEFQAPDCVAKLETRILGLSAGDAVCDLGSSSGAVLQGAQEVCPDASYVGIEKNYDLVQLAMMREMVTDGDAVYECADPLDCERTFDKVYANSPFGVRARAILASHPALADELEARCAVPQTADWVFAYKAIASTKETGKAVCCVLGGALSGTAESGMRQLMVENGLVEAVIALPGSLYAYTSLPVFLVVMSHGNSSVRFVDASDLGSKGWRTRTLGDSDLAEIEARISEDGEMSCTASLESIEERGWNLTPARYIQDFEVENGVPLAELVECIQRGSRLGKSELEGLATEEETGCSYLMLQDMDGGDIREGSRALASIDPSHEKYCLREGDIVVGKMNPFKVALAGDLGGAKILATGNLYIVRPKRDEVLPEYLRLYLGSKAGKRQMNSLCAGTTIRSISPSDFGCIKVPLIPMEEQSRIVDCYRALKQEIEVCRLKIARAEEKIGCLVAEGVE